MKHQHYRAALRRKLSIGRKIGACEVSDGRYAILFAEIAFSNHPTPIVHRRSLSVTNVYRVVQHCQLYPCAVNANG
jgi:hypothetical protein